MIIDQLPVLLAAILAAFAFAVLSAVGGPGGGVLMLGVFTALFGLRVAVPMLALTQLASNGARTWLNRRDLHWRLIGWFGLGAVPLAVAGGLLLAHAPAAPLKRLLGVFLIGVVVWRRMNPRPRKLGARAFVGVGAATGLGSALLGAVGPLTAPFFLAHGLTRAAYIGTEAASSLTVHLAKVAAYGFGDLLTDRVLVYGAVLTPAILAGAWVGRKIVGKLRDKVFVVIIEVGLVAAGALLLVQPP